MKNIRPLLSLLTLLLATSFATDALAQSDPSDPLYTAHQYSRAELISLDSFDQPPLTFKWTLADITQVPVSARMDFVLTLDADAQTVLNFFEQQSKANAPVATLHPKVLPFETNRELIVLGRSLNATPARFTLGGTGTHRFVIDVSADGTQTKIVVQNTMDNQIFSGVVPPRAPMTPKDANPVRFLWN